MKSQVYLFDLGGVLLDYVGPEQLSLLLEGAVSVAKVKEMWPESVSLRQFEIGKISASQFSVDFVDEWGLKSEPKDFLRTFSSWARGPYPGALPLLRELRGSATLACLTNINAAYWSRVRDEMGFGEVLHHCYASHELGLIKPDREIYEHVLHDLGCRPDQVTFFDDTQKNVDTALSLGMKAHRVQGVMELRTIIDIRSNTAIRKAAPDEAEYLSALALRSKAHWGYTDDFIKACRVELTYHSDQIESSSFHFIVAERHESIAGFYALKRVEPSTYELAALFVEPGSIGEGIGRLLIENAIDKVAGHGGESLLIQGDPNAEKFYLAAGAKQIGSQASESIPGRMLPLFKIAILARPGIAP